MTTKVNTIKEFINYCFYKVNNELYFGFNEIWTPEEDKNISPKLLKELKKLTKELI